MQKTDSLIRTKLHLPLIRSDLVPRPRLQEQIARGLCGPLTLVTAPAGFGKTTLVASYAASCGTSVAWLSLDKDDNQAGRFLSYIVAAVQEANHTIGNEAALLTAATQQAPTEVVLTSIINDLDITGREIILVLDDYQLITSQAVHEAVAFLLEHCPKTLHLVIATRSDPPLPLARLQGRGQMVELRAEDLRFTEPEAAQFLNEVMGLRLDIRSVTVLEERTEGWVAGLQMAALSMRDREDVLGFIESFSGTNRYILDYLLEEILANQPTEIQRFLLCTSILDRLTAALCEVVIYNESTGIREWSGKNNNKSSTNGVVDLSSVDSQYILGYLERANLFLVPLDDKRQWFRYHHLLADLLRARLDQLYPGLSRHLHLHAAIWFEQARMTVEAVNHYLAAGEYDRAARLVEENTTPLLAQGKLNALMGWIESLPAELRMTRPWLCIHQAYALAFAGQLDKVPSLLVQAEAIQDAAPIAGEADERHLPLARDDDSLSLAEGNPLAGAIATIRAMSAVMTGRDAEAISYVRRARDLLPARNLWDRSAAAWALGYALHSLGYLSEARSAFEEMVQLGRAMGNIWTLMTAVTDLAQVMREQGEICQARILLEEALAEASQKGAHSLGFIARPKANLARLLYEQNELEEAHHLLSEALALTHLWPNPNHMAFAYALQALVLLAEGNLPGARMSIGEADRINRSVMLTRLNRPMVEANLVRVWLACQAAGVPLEVSDPLVDQVEAFIAAWHIELADSVENAVTLMDHVSEITALTLACVYLGEGLTDKALSILEHLTRNAKAAGHTYVAIHSLILTAIALQSIPLKKEKPTLQTRSSIRQVPGFAELEEALSLAQPGGYVRVFLDEGRPVQSLLAQWLAHGGASHLRDYAFHLLSHFDAEPQAVMAAQEKASPTGGPGESQGRPAKDILVEPLSQREMEVLHLIALGRTNQEIALQLIVAPGTVKAHAASIYRKLDVANRTEAVARARQLGLLR